MKGTKNVELADNSFRIKTYLEILGRMSRAGTLIHALIIWFVLVVIFLDANFIRFLIARKLYLVAIFRRCVPANRTIKIDLYNKINMHEMRLYLLPKRSKDALLYGIMPLFCLNAADHTQTESIYI